MNVVLVGVSHKTAPVEIREKFCFPESRLTEALSCLKTQLGLEEAMILSTCNRVEIAAHCNDSAEGINKIKAFLADFHHLDNALLDAHLYTHTSIEAIRHLFRVTASLDSMMVGEPQILGQVKNAFSLAQTAGTLGATLNAIISRAFFVAKRVRSETAIAGAAVSISYAAVELAKKIFDTLNDKTVMILGAGKMSELAAKHLASSGISKVLVWNRTYSRAQDLAQVFNGEAIPSDELARHLHRADIIISSTGSPTFLLNKADGQQLIHMRKNHPVFIIDIAVPRDIDPEVNNIDNIFLYDIDDLRNVIDANRKQRMREAVFAEAIVNEEVEAFRRRLASLDVAPSIVALREHWERVRKEELEKFKKNAMPLTAKQEAAMESLTQSLLNKLLHGPITTLKDLSHRADGEPLADEIKKMLGLKEGR